MKSKSLVPITASIAALMVALAGCSAAEPESEVRSSPVDLRMTVWSNNPDQLALFEQIGADYAAQSDGAVNKVVIESTPFADYVTALRTQLAGGDPPDVSWIPEGSALEFVQSGALVEVGETLMADESYEFDDIIPSALNLWEDDSGLYAYPFSNSPFATFVNQDLFTAAGIPTPAEMIADGNWTWDALRDAASTIAARTGKAGLVLPDFDYVKWNGLAEIWTSWGAAPWSADGTECTFQEPEMIDAMSWIHDAIFIDGAIPGPGTSADFFAGESAMALTLISRANGLDNSFGWDLVPLPEGPVGYAPVMGQAAVTAIAAGEHTDLAVDFLAYLTNPDNAAKLAQFYPAPRNSILNVDTLAAANPVLSSEQLESVVIDALPTAVTLPAHSNFGEIDEAVRVQLDGMWTADGDVEATMANVCDAIEPLLGG